MAFLARRPSPLTLKTEKQETGNLHVHLRQVESKKILTLTMSREVYKEVAEMAGRKHLKLISWVH